MYHCKQHGLNYPSNFSINKKLVLKNNNKIGKPFGASAVTDNNKPKVLTMKVLKPEVKLQLGSQSFDNIRNMCGLNNEISNQLKGASVPNNIPLCDKRKALINIKNMFGLN
jgi:hypothetical protein